MSLKKFLEYRNDCPVCAAPNLSTFFVSKKKQEHIIGEDTYTVKTPLYSSNHRRHYDVGYVFNLHDDTFWIDFYSKYDVKIEEAVPKFLTKKFRDYDDNIKFYKFYKVCLNCKKYNYISNSFSLNLKDSRIFPFLEVFSEYFGLSQKMEEGYKLIRVLNCYPTNKTCINFCYGVTTDRLKIGNNQYFSLSDLSFNTLTIPLLNFSSEDKMIERINKLVVFS